MRLIKYISALLLALVIILPFSNCSDDLATEVKEINYDRLFSPTSLSSTVINNVNVRLQWTKNSLAESYSIELFADDSLSFSGSPARTITDVKASQLPYVVEGLDGATRYSARVKAVSSSISESKWSPGVTFKTGTENILLPFEDRDVTAESVTLRWTAGQTATSIVVQPGNITHNVTSSEIVAGVASVSGLNPETEYTAQLMNNDKVRGTVSFKTLVDIGNAIPVTPEDDFLALLQTAEDGDAFALFPGVYGDASKFEVSKNIEIKGVYPFDKPILNGYITISGNSSLTLENIIIDGGDLKDRNQAIIFATADATYGDIIVESCEIRNHVKGLYYLNVAALVESITINNSLLYDIECVGGDFMDSRSGAIKVLKLSNSTISNSAIARDLIRYDNASENFPGITSQIIVDRNTFYNVCNGTSRRLLYVRFADNQITFTNNIVASTLGIFSNESLTGVPAFDNNNYFQAPGFLPGGSTASLIFDDTGISIDPQFENPVSGNFKVKDDDILSLQIGDPRWR